MNSEYYYNWLHFLGLHPRYSFGKKRVIFNSAGTVYLVLLILFKAYQERGAANMKTIGEFGFLIIKYLTLLLGRNKIKQLVTYIDSFWKVGEIKDEKIFFLKHHSRTVRNFYITVCIFGYFVYTLKPFFKAGTSVFNSYVPKFIPFYLFYIFECYYYLFGSTTCNGFSVLINSFIVVVVMQFRLLNLKIKDIGAVVIESEDDLKILVRRLKKIIKYQQFLIGYVKNLNELLNLPLTSLMVSTITIICINMYNLSTQQGDYGTITIISIDVVVEFFMVFGLPAQILMDESTATAYMIYSEWKWYSPKLRRIHKDLLFIIARSQKGVCIKLASYHIVNHQTVVVILKTAYSFYTFLQGIIARK